MRHHVEPDKADHHPGHHPLQARHLQLNGEEYCEDGDHLEIRMNIWASGHFHIYMSTVSHKPVTPVEDPPEG